MPTPRVALLISALACHAMLAQADEHDHDHGHHDHDHGHHNHDHGHAHEHDIINLDVNSWDKVVSGDEHVWAVKFYSGMCSSCQSFAPHFETAKEELDGLHWAQVDIDRKAGMQLASRFGVLEEGIPNVKLINAADAPLPIVTGDTPAAAIVVQTIRDTLSAAGAKVDAAGYFVSSVRTEL